MTPEGDGGAKKDGTPPGADTPPGGDAGHTTTREKPKLKPCCCWIELAWDTIKVEQATDATFPAVGQIPGLSKLFGTSPFPDDKVAVRQEDCVEGHFKGSWTRH
jgi:hypothetical protein